MNENVLDVLLYLFDNFVLFEVSEEPEIARQDLNEIGFHPEEIEHAIGWLRMTQMESNLPIQESGNHSIRIYTNWEKAILDVACRNYIAWLERVGVLSAPNRELLIDRVLALVDDHFDAVEIEHIKWITMMILTAVDRQGMARARMEAVLQTESTGIVH